MHITTPQGDRPKPDLSSWGVPWPSADDLQRDADTAWAVEVGFADPGACDVDTVAFPEPAGSDAAMPGQLLDELERQVRERHRATAAEYRLIRLLLDRAAADPVPWVGPDPTLDLAWSDTRGRTVAAVRAQHEALINAAFQGRAATIMCPYDVARLPEHVVTDAYATHPTVIHPGSRTEQDSTAYAPEDVVARYNEALPPVPEALVFAFDSDSLSHARHVAVGEGARLGLVGVKLEDLALATAELTTNSVVHGGGSGVLRVWPEDGYVVCEVQDEGRITDVLAGRRPVPRDQRGGRGILLVNLIADLVRVHRGDNGTTVRCWFAR